MAKQREIFVKGCAEVNNIPAAKANQIFDLLEKFAGYGFNKSHAAAYAVVAYQTAYLKANYPVEFFCAMMTNDMADTEKLSQYIAEARGMGIEVLPPDVNESQVYFAPARPGAPASLPASSDGPETAGRDAALPVWPSASGWRPSRAWARSRWKPYSRPAGKAGNSNRWPTCASAWMGAR